MRRKPSPEDLEASRDLRVQQRRLERMEEYLALLARAGMVRREAGEPDNPELEALIHSARALHNNLQLKATGTVFGRRRPKAPAPGTAECLVFLDECGAHHLLAAEKFPVFCLAAVVVPEPSYEDLDLHVRTWKATHLGDADLVIHEPEIRQKVGPWRDSGRSGLLTSLAGLISDLDFALVVSVLRREEYLAQFGRGPLDESLPGHPYLMCLDFLLERTVMALEANFAGGRAKLIAESRGPKEDALLQHEFARLHLEGTAYIAAAWFRQALHPGIHFEGKGGRYASGLQLADLAARPCGEKVADSTSTPDRWPEVRMKLCAGNETKNSILGLKILPWDEAFAELWKS